MCILENREYRLLAAFIVFLCGLLVFGIIGIAIEAFTTGAPQ